MGEWKGFEGGGGCWATPVQHQVRGWKVSMSGELRERGGGSG